MNARTLELQQMLREDTEAFYNNWRAYKLLWGPDLVLPILRALLAEEEAEAAKWVEPVGILNIKAANENPESLAAGPWIRDEITPA